jgi:uncharacterized protein YoxC
MLTRKKRVQNRDFQIKGAEMLLEIGVLVVGIALLVFIVFAIPSLLQIWRTARSIEMTTEILNRDLPAILGNINRITDDVSDTTTRVRNEITQLSSAGDKVADMVDQLSGVESQLKHSVIEPLSDMLTTLAASTRALNAFIRTLRSG